MESVQWGEKVQNHLPLSTEIQLLRKAVEQGRASVDLLLRLGNRLSQLADYQAAADIYRQVTTIDPQCFRAYCTLGETLCRLADYPGAAGAYQGALCLEPQSAEVHYRLGELLSQTGQVEEAKASLMRALTFQPDHIEAHNELAILGLKQGDPEAALTSCNTCLDLVPGNTTALALKAAVLRELGDHEAAFDLVDWDRLLRQIHLNQGLGPYQDVEALNAQLDQFLCTHPQLVFEPSGRSTHQGYQAVIHDSSATSITQLRAIIHREVEHYIRSLMEEAPHPFLAYRPPKLSLHMWGVVLGQNGHETPHIHPSAWLSGVYYVKVPQTEPNAVEPHAGWIEFGRPYPSLGCAAVPAIKRVKPEAGMMLLFPAYFFHCTIPVESSEKRISIGFDIYNSNST